MHPDAWARSVARRNQPIVFSSAMATQAGVGSRLANGLRSKHRRSFEWRRAARASLAPPTGARHSAISFADMPAAHSRRPRWACRKSHRAPSPRLLRRGCARRNITCLSASLSQRRKDGNKMGFRSLSLISVVPFPSPNPLRDRDWTGGTGLGFLSKCCAVGLRNCATEILIGWLR